jgi:hypothetical protein
MHTLSGIRTHDLSVQAIKAYESARPLRPAETDVKMYIEMLWDG